jgi:hypothetical protein
MLGSVNRAIYDWADLGGWITEWMVAGPYTMEGKKATDLFDVAFEPEQSGKADWRSFKGGGRAPWAVNLGAIAGFAGDDRVAYLRAQVFSPKAQAARLDVTTDDGVKVWLNGKVVHAANIARPPFNPDRVKVSLRKGWNPLLLKVTNLDAGWEAWVRVVAPDGNNLDGRRMKAE